jgi:cytochrome c oxidase subunit 2
MPVLTRLRRLSAAALPAVLVVVFAACNNAAYPNSVFHNHTEFNREVGYLFKWLIWLGTFVFIFVELLLLWAIWKYRRRSENDRPEHVHGNTTLEILWTAIPALILAFIAVPTVRTIFNTQAKAKSDALQVEVIGHQWWWEFRYPQYKITTANELYLPVGRTVNFALKSADVLHSFSIPQLGGKRDLITNHTNYLWFTPDSIGVTALNGMCAEYCGASHANMRFKTFTVTPADFESWAKHQASPAVFGAVAPAAAVPGAAAAAAVQGVPQPASQQQAAQAQAGVAGQTTGPGNVPNAMGPHVASAPAPAHDMSTMTAGAGVQQAGYIAYPRERMPAHTVPNTPLPPGITDWNMSLVGDAERGRVLTANFATGCAGCHAISGVPTMQGQIGPNLTHVGSRTTIAGGLYPNDTRHLALWIKNARYMKPGSYMPTLGAFQRDPIQKLTIPKTGLSDQQIADIVAYLQALK